MGLFDSSSIFSSSTDTVVQMLIQLIFNFPVSFIFVSERVLIICLHFFLYKSLCIFVATLSHLIHPIHSVLCLDCHFCLVISLVNSFTILLFPSNHPKMCYFYRGSINRFQQVAVVVWNLAHFSPRMLFILPSILRSNWKLTGGGFLLSSAFGRIRREINISHGE